MNIPRKEYPRPHFARKDWQNLNGCWDFCIDNEREGVKKGFFEKDFVLGDKITVPFCPESRLSGVEHKDFMLGVWYKRKVMIDTDKRTVLHFGAVDYYTTVYVNGKLVGYHKGGYVSFSFDITDYVVKGENEITVYAQDDTKDTLIPSGKQSDRFESYDCMYTRTTGIWQTVWLEFTEKDYIDYVKYYPDYKAGSITVQAFLAGKGDFSAKVSYEGKDMGEYCLDSASGTIMFTISLKEKHLWEVGNGRLYDIDFTFGKDTVSSYFGLRSIELQGRDFLINGKRVFQRLVLDQGFYPDGIYTAPTDEDLVGDIKLSLAAGFNGARLHEKIFEERFLYYADKMGYIVWGEFPNWGLDIGRPDGVTGILGEWTEEIKRDFNHPSIIGWCPLNETWHYNNRKIYEDNVALVYNITKAADTTRPCIDTSGGHHVLCDVFCVHCYQQNPEIFKAKYDEIGETGDVFDGSVGIKEYDDEVIISSHYKGRNVPILQSEYGGIRWSNKDGWGYGEAPKDIEEYYTRLKGLTDALLGNPYMIGYCFTQLTDVEQEQNGIYNYDRSLKFDMDRIKSIFGGKAVNED